MNWFKYRLPNATEIVGGASPKLINGFGNGFVVAPFSNPKEKTLTIPLDIIPGDSDIYPEDSPISPSTPKDDYLNEVRSIIDALAGDRGKTVAARTIRIDTSIDINKTFDALCAYYPEAFVFAFSTVKTGTWIGASPELLLRIDGNTLSTMALAGTRRSSSVGDWDDKNIEEQQLVVEFIAGCLEKNCGNVNIGNRFTKKAGGVEHLCTPISATLSSATSNHTQEIADLLYKLSPTPALCGSDREMSLTLIDKLEKFPREMYGGFCGPNGINGSTAFFVTLRTAKCSRDAVCAYIGGGIMHNSNPETEWTETELKSKTIINQLKE